jgi:hypothetical protein
MVMSLSRLEPKMVIESPETWVRSHYGIYSIMLPQLSWKDSRIETSLEKMNVRNKNDS